jgi:MFS family permease
MSEFRRGWPLLLGAFIGIAVGVSSLYFYSLGLFLKPVAAEFGWSRGAASLGPLIGVLGAAIAAAPTGRMMDRIGPVRTAIVAMLLLAVCFAALGFLTQGLVSFLIITGTLSLITVGSTPLAFSRLIVGAFDRHRGFALGLVLTGTGVGAALMPVLLSPYIATHGWRAGYLALAVIAAAATVPLALLLRGRGGAPGERTVLPPLSGVTASPAFRLLGVIFLLAAMGALGTVVHFPAMLSDAGLSPARAGALAGTIGIAVIAGRGVAGLMLDRLPAPIVTASFFAISAIGLALLGAGGATLALPGALALGLSVGAEVDLIAYLVSRLFPRTVYGTVYGGIYALFLLGGAIGPAIIGLLFDLTGGYRVSMFAAASCLAAAALLALRISRLPLVAEAPIHA